MKFGIAKVNQPWGPSRRFAEALNSNEFAKTSRYVRKIAKLTPAELIEHRESMRAAGIL